MRPRITSEPCPPVPDVAMGAGILVDDEELLILLAWMQREGYAFDIWTHGRAYVVKPKASWRNGIDVQDMGARDRIVAFLDAMNSDGEAVQA